MDVIARVSQYGKNIGFLLNDGGMEWEVLDRGMYTEVVLTALKDSGYKILDYNCDMISPTGISIKDLTVRETTASEEELQMMLDEAEQCLSEPECVKYFTHDTRMEEFKFKEPTNPEIKTREELIDYLNQCFSQYMTAKVCYDVRPLNSFVAREALFDISEVAGNKDVRQLFYIMSLRRKLSSYTAYRNLVKYLVGQGVLLTDTPTPTEVTEAYTAWGIDGIKTPCYKRVMQINVDGEINAVNEAATTQAVYANRRSELGVMSRDGVLSYDGDEVDGYDIIQWSREPIVPSSPENYNNALSTSRSWDTEHKVIPVLVIPKRDRIYFELMNEEGFPYTVKIQHDRICMFNSYSCFHDTSYLILKGMDNGYMTLDEAKTSRDYYIMNMCISKAYDMINSVTKDVPVVSSYDLCRKEGLNPEAAIKYLARRIYENVYGCTTTSEYNKMNLWLASELYRTGPTQTLLDKYNPDNEPYANIDELISIMLDKQAQMINDGTLQITEAKGNSIDEDQEMRLRPLESLAFVKSCFDHEVNIEFFGDGLMADEGDSVRIIAHLIRTIIKMKLGKDASLSSVTQFIKDVDSASGVDVKSIIKNRDNAYRGYLKDRAVLNGRRGAESNYILYVTKIFREIANVPSSECRHYAIEAFALDVREKQAKTNRETQIAIANAVIAASENSSFTREMQWIVTKQAFDIASKIFIGIIFKNIEVMKNNGEYYVEVKVGDGRQLKVLLDAGIVSYISNTNWSNQIKYISLCDYCMNEVSANTKFCFYCINADIDPWFVKPKEGFTIPEYNFFVNFCDERWFANFSDEWKNEVATTAAKPVTIYDRQFSANIVSYSEMDVEADKSPYDESTIDVVLDEVYAETFNLYRQRFQIHNATAKKNGEYLRQMRLKSDVRFFNFGDKCDALVLEEDEYATLVNKTDASMFAKSVAPSRVDAGRGFKRITAETCTIREFNISDYEYGDAMSWYHIMSGEFNPKGVVYVYMGYIMVIGSDGSTKNIRISEINMETANWLVSTEHAYQIFSNQFYIPAANGNYVLEVK